MKAAIVIPARYQSSRFPGKPLALINGMSLIERTVRQVQKCQSIDTILVATDDARIYDHVTAFGGKACMTSSSCMTGTDRVAEAARTSPLLADADIIINVQGDEPCIDPKIIEQVRSLLASDRSVDIATAACPISSEEELASPNVVKCTLSLSKKVLYFSRAPIPSNKNMACNISKGAQYLRHIGLFAFTKQSLLSFSQAAPTPLQIEEDIELIRALEHDMTIRACIAAKQAPGVDIPEDVESVKKWVSEIDCMDDE